MANQSKTTSPFQRLGGFANFIRKNRLIMTLFLLVQGILTLLTAYNPMLGSAKVTAVLIGAAGLISLIGYLVEKEKKIGIWVMAVISAALLGIGIYFFLNPDVLALALHVVFGIIVILTGLQNLIQALKVEEKSGAGWWISLITALIAVVVGILMILKPFSGEMVGRFTAVALIYAALSNLWSMYRARKTSK